MKILSDKKYQEYLELKRLADQSKIWESAKSIANLEDDIDYPIKLSVAMLALAGCHPLFSCCGFNYDGQPFHKSHEYGNPYIMVENTEMGRKILGGIQSPLISGGWKLSARGGVVYLELFLSMNPQWRSPGCIHFSEECVIAINSLERILYGNLSLIFLSSVILQDTNVGHKKRLRYWQYPPKEEWEITKDWAISQFSNL